jgi:D-alanine-D-alanine ligase
MTSDPAEWRGELDVWKALENLGHEVRPIGLYRDIIPLLTTVNEWKPELVFNMCESFDRNRDNEPHLTALLELLGVAYTGARTGALGLCKDKGLTKKILGFHRVRVPKFEVSTTRKPHKALRHLKYPCVVKPLGFEGSEGIAQTSFVENREACLERIDFIHKKFGVDAIAEEYIEGREIYVGVIGRERLTVLPPRELFFREVPVDKPRIATFKAKWDDEYRKRWGIASGRAKPIEPAVMKRIEDTCRKIYKLFSIDGYARMDLRLDPNSDVVFIEANPNPSIAKEDDFAQSAKQAGMTYEDLIGRIVSIAVP